MGLTIPVTVRCCRAGVGATLVGAFGLGIADLGDLCKARQAHYHLCYSALDPAGLLVH